MAEWHWTWECVWSEELGLNSSMQKKKEKMAITDAFELLQSGCEHNEGWAVLFSGGDYNCVSPPMAQTSTNSGVALVHLFTPGENAQHE